MQSVSLNSALILILLASTVPFQRASAQAPIPSLHGKALNGDTVNLPDALKGRPAILVLGFSQTSRNDVTAWGKRLAVDLPDAGNVRQYEMPVLASIPGFLRSFVLRRIAASVPDRAKAHFVPIYDHENEWRSLAGYSKPDDAYILLVDAAGQVRWRTQGFPSDASYGEVRSRIAALQPR